jgi:hypothetical protein
MHALRVDEHGGAAGVAETITSLLSSDRNARSLPSLSGSYLNVRCDRYIWNPYAAEIASFYIAAAIGELT